MSGTLNAFVDYLLNSDAAGYSGFLREFLWTFRCFSTVNTILEKLQTQYEKLYNDDRISLDDKDLISAR